jgi:hypothetical protein
MLFGNDRDRLREFYCQAWACHRQGQTLEALQAQIVAVVEQHPEYHPLLENPEQALGKDYLPELGETNPFLHMGMHLAIQEQVSSDRPAGIRALYSTLLEKLGDAHQLEHRFMECLAEMFWQAQKDGINPDEQHYLECLGTLARDF